MRKFAKVTEFEEYAKGFAPKGAFNYKFLHVLERVLDENGDVVQVTHLVQDKKGRLQFTIRLNELRDVKAVQSILRESDILNVLGLHKRIMGQFAVFRHKQYVAFVFPAYSSLRDRLDIRYRFKKSDPRQPESQLQFQKLYKWDKDLGNQLDERYRAQPGVFDRNSVAYVLRGVVKALAYLHSKGYAHTQLCASNLYMNENSYVKLGGFCHARRMHSQNWNFVGNANYFPPEVMMEQKGDLEVEPSFDVWSLGLLTLELISGRRERHNDGNARALLEDYLKGKETPKLEEYDPSTYKDGVCVYDEDVEDFLSQLLRVDKESRPALGAIRGHAFLDKSVDKKLAAHVWNIATSVLPDEGRSIQSELLRCQGPELDLYPDFLINILRALRLAAREFFPVFDEVPEDKLLNKFVALEASVVVPYNSDEDWSREVLDVSQQQFDSYEEYQRTVRRIEEPTDAAPGRKLTGEHFTLPQTHPSKDGPKHYNRNDQVFFIRKSWSDEERQIFIALQFCRWYTQGLIEFADIIRLCSDLEDLFNDYIIESRMREVNRQVNDIYWATPLRRIVTNPKLFQYEHIRPLHNAYLNLALKPETVLKLKKKYDVLLENDPVETPKGKTTLQISATFKEMDLLRFKKMEDLLLGEKRVDNWEFDSEAQLEDQKGPECTLLPLVYERRRNPNQEHKTKEAMNEHADQYEVTSNQARTIKIWSDYDRDYVYKKCNIIKNYELPQSDAEKLFGHPFREQETKENMPNFIEDLEGQLLRGKVYQEKDYIKTFKQHDFVEGRQHALNWAEEAQGRMKDKSRFKVPIAKQASVFDTSFDDAKHVHLSPAPKLSRKLERLPKNR